MHKVKGLFIKAESQNDNGKGLPRPFELQPPGIKNEASTRSSSLYPQGDFRNGNKESILDIKADIMCSWLHTQQSEKLWSAGGIGEGVVLKKGKGDFTCAPFTLQADHDGLFDQVVAMNVKAALTVNTRVIQLFLQYNTSKYIPLPDGLRLQVLPSMADLPRCQKHHFGAFIRDRQMLVVWDDDPLHLLPRALHLEQSLMQMTWGNEGAVTSDEDVKAGPNVFVEEAADEDLERRSAERRPVMLIHAVISGLTLTILTGALGFGFRNLAQEVGIDGKYTRLALLAVLPCQVFVSLFFMQVIIGNLAQCFGPISQMNHNSRFYSGVKPPQLSRENASLPHITIQMPVYKEGLSAVIQPTIFSLKKAISTYEMQGGTASIFVNDDGMQIIDEEKAQARREFYNEHSIGWVARPPHNPPKSKSAGKGLFGRKTGDEPEGEEKVFLRRGKFKKASNMNYALMISNKVEDKLTTFQRPETWTQDDEHKAYLDCLSQVLNEQNGQAWAEGNIRVGDYILLIDSDTRVPVDCLLDAASEMEMSPEVGILQYASGVLQVTDSFFENAVTFFTNLIYSAVRFGVANGDVSPFVGHNAVLRWSAIQDVASYIDEDNYEKFWSESHVSEDFDMALRLQTAGYTIRYGAYTGVGFKEGVSLTVYDELNRWEKYAYGCNEMLFHPFRLWFTKGPFTPLFRRFVGSNMPIGSKITIISYIGTYYAIGAAWLLTLANYFLVGWARDYLDKYYLESFKIYFAIVIVFNGLGNVALAVVRYRLSEKSLFGSLFENFKWVILFTIFFSGISLHISQALLCHFFEIDMTWGATAKEVEQISFFDEIPRLLKRFKITFLFCFVSAGIMIACALYIPWEWRITTFNAIWPLTTVVAGHFLLPVALNPALMMFTW